MNLNCEQNANTTKRGTKVCEKQKQMLIECMKMKPELLSGKFTSSFTHQKAMDEWKEIASSLNSIPGSKKDWKGWRKTWQELRSRTKSKLGQNKKNAGKTGGGSSEEIPISTIEKDVLEIIKKVSVDGHNNNESIVEFQDDLGLNGDLMIERISPVAEPVAAEIEERDTNATVPSLNFKTEVKNKSKRVLKKTSYLTNSANASLEYKDYLKKKLESKENYYQKKLELLRRSVEAKERKNTVLENISNSLGHLVDQRLLL